MPASGISLVDLNVWLALAFDGHVHHPTALNWFKRGAANTAGFCRITQLGLLRLLTNRSVMGPFVLTQRGAWEGYERLCRDERVVFLEEPMDLEKHWRQLTPQDSTDHKTWTDAYLAGFAISGQIPLVTFDRGFCEFKGLQLDLLEACK